MESNGYKIPEEILQWAHAQQEADVTDYVMVSDATALEDNTTAATGSSKDELANLQKKARQNIAKADQAIEDATQSVKEYNFVSDKAKKIKKDKEKNFKNTMDEKKEDRELFRKSVETFTDTSKTYAESIASLTVRVENVEEGIERIENNLEKVLNKVGD